MNIKITHNWLLEYLETMATPDQIRQNLSLCGPSVEKIEKSGDDYVYDIEVTSNRIDTASVLGVAQEAQAILPQFGLKAQLKNNPLEKYKFTSLKTGSADSLKVEILDRELCSRFTAVVLDNIEVKGSPNFIKKRLNLCGINSINNVVDISNYLMISLGQPTHVFDYDKITGGLMKMRLSRKGEKIITLDGKDIVLPGGDIVIEDGSGKLIDLCGIMGGFNSAVSAETKKIVLFVQTYNKKLIRKTSMLTGQRSVAATYFEKGLDEERVEPTLVYGAELLEKYAGGRINSKLYDIYPSKVQQKSVKIKLDDFERIIGKKIPSENIIKILTGLGFINSVENGWLKVEVPTYRVQDIDIKEDLIEEVARVYGFHNLPNHIQTSTYIQQPPEFEKLFKYQLKVKFFLKHLGMNEVMNYSMVSEKTISDFDLLELEHLKIKNAISNDITHLRRLLMPSLVKNIKDNEGKKDVLRMFEIAKTYEPRPDHLPVEEFKLGLVTNTGFSDLKGIVEALFKELNIDRYKSSAGNHRLLNKNLQIRFVLGDSMIAELGQLKEVYRSRLDLKSDVYLAFVDFNLLMNHAKTFSQYRPINPFATIKLDLTIKTDPKTTYETVRRSAFKESSLLEKLEFLGVYKDSLNLRFFFSSRDRNITENEAKDQLQKIKNSISKVSG